MILRVLGHGFHYECENLCRVFYPNEKIAVVRDMSGKDSKEVTTQYENGVCTVSANIDDSFLSMEAKADYESAELEIATQIYSVLSGITGYTPSWGVLTGVRPSKLMMKLMSSEGEERAFNYFTDSLLVKSEKARLSQTVAKAEREIINSVSKDSVSLYVSIPFCPSRCSYCSFVSHSIATPSAAKLLPSYVDKLKEEIKAAGVHASNLGLKLQSVYFGGGTPGILSAEYLDTLQSAIEESFDMTALAEYTVELGRPDTVSDDKLQTLIKHHTGRISINPQSFNQKTLDAIGRAHSVQAVFEAYENARKYPFDSINMDLIAGLPGEEPEDFEYSLDKTISLAPENVTVHSLALKRSSTMNYEGETVKRGEKAEKMLSYASKALTNSGYSPYYMYRQSKCVGNLENVGWCLENKKSFYNVIMMEECQTVIGVGAGAVTKLCDPSCNNIQRIFNYKYPYEYISGFEEMLERKKGIEDFYAQA